jgi:hypothetical protein
MQVSPPLREKAATCHIVAYAALTEPHGRRRNLNGNTESPTVGISCSPHLSVGDNMNKFQTIVHRRLQVLRLEAESAGEPEHNATAGFLREKYIGRFLRDMTPWGVSLTSGVLFDLADRTSPQMDIIATLSSVMPTIILDESLSMVPVEAALWAIEIKTKLTTDGLNQVTRQNQWLSETGVALNSPRPINLPTAILSLDSELSKETVVDWMQEQQTDKFVNGNTVMCCVIGKFHLIRQGREVRQIEPDGHYIETMHFISDYWGGLAHLARERRDATPVVCPSSPYPHPLEAYLKGLK